MNRDSHSEAVVDPEFSVQLIESLASDIKSHQVIDILSLMNLTWPDEDTEKSVAEKVAGFYEDPSEKICYCLYQDKELVGYAESIPLTIKSSTLQSSPRADGSTSIIGGNIAHFIKTSVPIDAIFVWCAV